jgi:hypothetical protein
MIALLCLSGCTTQTPSGVTLNSSKPSTIEGLAVPKQAQPQTYSTYDVAHLMEYALPRGVSLSVLDSWYQGRLAFERPWHGWPSCREASSGFQRGWTKGKSALALFTFAAHGQVYVQITELDNRHSTCLLAHQ